ncbi:hypothetical protein CHUAL_008178 [Chamberlinius hualienensis]
MFPKSLKWALISIILALTKLTASQAIDTQPCFGVPSHDVNIQKLTAVSPLYAQTSNMFENCTELTFNTSHVNDGNGLLTIKTLRADEKNPNGGQVILNYYLENVQPGQYRYYLSSKPTGQPSGKINIVGYNDNKSFALVFCGEFNYYYTVSSKQNESDAIVNQLDALIQPINHQIDHFYLQKNKTCH